jgi:hypothetical protein
LVDPKGQEQVIHDGGGDCFQMGAVDELKTIEKWSGDAVDIVLNKKIEITAKPEQRDVDLGKSVVVGTIERADHVGENSIVAGDQSSVNTNWSEVIERLMDNNLCNLTWKIFKNWVSWFCAKSIWI